MKKLTILMIIITLFTSCGDMNESFQEFLDRGEVNYLGKPDSVMTYAGHNRIKFTWLVNHDPRIESCHILWNDKQDTLVYKIDRSLLDTNNMASAVFDNIKEGTFIFYVYHVGKNGYDSISEEVIGRIYGEFYESSLINRKIKSMFISDQGLELGWTTADENTVRSILTYSSKEGRIMEVEVLPTENTIVLDDYLPGGEYTIQTDYLPEEGAIDIFSIMSDVMNFPE